MIYRATYGTRSKQLGSTLSDDLRKKYGKRSVRIVEGDSIKIIRGEFKGVDGKVGKVSVENNSIAVEGVKKEKTKGEKFDVYIHSSNVIITGLNTEDKRRIARLEGKKPVKSEPKEEIKEEKSEKKVKETPKKAKKEVKEESDE